MNPWPDIAVGAALGAALGSFAVTYGLRWTRAESALRGRSACGQCGVTLGFSRTVPLLSYAAQRGACFACGGRIDIAHPTAEALGALAGGVSFALLPILPASLATGLAALLAGAGAADLRVRRLPDSMTLAAALLCAGLSFTLQGMMGLLAGVAAAVVTFSLLYGLRALGARLRGRVPLGLGDVKLAAALALWLGPATPLAIAAASLAGLVGMAIERPADGRLAFGPYLALAGWLVALFSEVSGWRMTL